MCVLCSEFVMDVHWSDFQIGYSDNSTVVVGDHQRDRRRNRIHRTSLANKILLYYGIKLEDWNGSKYILRDKKGQIEIVNDLGSLWSAVTKLSHKVPDPLDPDLLNYMSKSW